MISCIEITYFFRNTKKSTILSQTWGAQNLSLKWNELKMSTMSRLILNEFILLKSFKSFLDSVFRISYQNHCITFTFAFRIFEKFKHHQFYFHIFYIKPPDRLTLIEIKLFSRYLWKTNRNGHTFWYYLL